MSRTLKDYNSPLGKPNWCAGCGNFGTDMALKQAMAKLDLDPDKVAVVGGIGCGASMPYWTSCYNILTLHGRPVPVATGIKLANHDLNVVVLSGDGDAYGIGMEHFIHGMRRNANIVYLVGNNSVYGLTKGQASPAAKKGFKSPSTPFGSPDPAVNPIALALSSGCTFVARGYAGNPVQLSALIKQAIEHKGFALIDISQSCTSYNKLMNHDYFLDNNYSLEDAGHDSSNFESALKHAFSVDKKAIGLFYKTEREVYEDNQPQFKNGPLAKHDITNVNVEKLFEEYSV